MAGASGLPVTLALPGIGDLLADDIDWRPSYRVITSEYAGENIFDRLTNDLPYTEQADEAETLREIADLTNPQVATSALATCR